MTGDTPIPDQLRRHFHAEIRYQCEIVIRAFEELTAALAQEDYDIWWAADAVVVAAANARKLLWGKEPRWPDWRKSLRDELEVGDDSPFMTADLRNDLEHIDERLDEWWRRSDRHNLLDRNIGPLTPGFDRRDHLRNYHPATFTLTFWGDEANLSELAVEARRVLQALTAT